MNAMSLEHLSEQQNSAGGLFIQCDSPERCKNLTTLLYLIMHLNFEIDINLLQIACMLYCCLPDMKLY